MNIKLGTVWLLFWSLTGLQGFAQDDSIHIWTPRPHNPVFSQPGSTFTIEVSGNGDLSRAGWHVQAKNDLKTWECQVISVVRGLINHQTESGWLLNVRLPTGISPELMTLVVGHTLVAAAQQPRSLSIVPSLEEDFYILQQSDQHLTLDMAVEPGGKSSASQGHGSKQALQWMTPVVNLIHPRLILQTGDNMHLYNVANDWCGMEEAKERVDRFMEGLAGLTVASVLATGNHDMGWSDYVQIGEWRNFYTEYVGQRAFSFRMGSFYVLNSEWTSDEFLGWAKSDYVASWKDPGIRYRLLISHFYDGLDGWTTVANQEKPADLLLVGHNHRTRILQTSPYTVLSVGTAQDHQRAAFFNFHRTDSAWASPQVAGHADGVNVHRLLGDDGAPTVSAVYTHENNGTAQSNAVRIANSLPHDFYDGRIRFLMKKGAYTVTNAEILAQYDVDGGQTTAVLVRVDIRPQGETSVTINALH